MYTTTPRYKQLYACGELARRAEMLRDLWARCGLCPWECRVNRPGGEQGRCGATAVLKVAKALPHFGEEPPVSGTRGSGTIFFSHCHLRCCFCQNYQISQEGLGAFISVEQLAEHMLSLQEQGCHNINLVSPTHYLPLIVEALHNAAARGLQLPLVYNSNGYESVETLRVLDGIVDIYLPDAKYGTAASAQRYSRACGYPAVNMAAIKEMFRQVGYLVTDHAGIAVKGLIIRHLVLPDNLARTETLLQSLHSIVGPEIHISLMGQYQPVFKAHRNPELNRRPTTEEYQRAVHALCRLGFENGWVQDPENIDCAFLPDFEKSDSWN